MTMALHANNNVLLRLTEHEGCYTQTKTPNTVTILEVGAVPNDISYGTYVTTDLPDTVWT